MNEREQQIALIQYWQEHVDDEALRFWSDVECDGLDNTSAERTLRIRSPGEAIRATLSSAGEPDKEQG